MKNNYAKSKNMGEVLQRLREARKDPSFRAFLKDFVAFHTYSK